MKKFFILFAVLFLLSGCAKQAPELTNQSTNIDPNGNVGQACQLDSDCKTPFSFLIQSNCPFGSICLNQQCAVVCPISNFTEMHTEQQDCQTNKDCDCSQRTQSIDCVCHKNFCLSVEQK